MAILRHRLDREFTVIPNAAIRRSGLSLKGVGLLCTLLSLPDDWAFSIAGLCSICARDKRDGISTALKELEGAGYLIRERSRRPDGTVGDAVWTVSDAPMSENPAQDSPTQDSPTLENPQLQINDGTKERVNQERRLEASPTRSRFVPPSVDEVREYCTERRNNIDPQRFVDYYSASGWKRGKTPIKDWKACVRTWERGESSKHQNNVPDYSAYGDESL